MVTTVHGSPKIYHFKNIRLKPQVERAHYHVMTRTAQGAHWFDRDEFRQTVYDTIVAYASIYYVDLAAICCMSNHYHIAMTMRRPQFDRDEVKRRFLLMQALRAQPRKWSVSLEKIYHDRFCDLSKCMWDVNRSLSWTYNKRYGTSGHLWGSRFKSLLVESMDNLLKVMTYIELNPVRAGLVERPQDYDYNSIGKWLAKRESKRNEAGFTLPGVGFLSELEPPDRLEAYRLYLNRIAGTVTGTSRPGDAHPRLEALLGNLDIKPMLQTHASGSLTRWGRKTLGSPDFLAKSLSQPPPGTTWLGPTKPG